MWEEKIIVTTCKEKKNNGRREVEIGEEQQPHAIRTTRGVNNWYKDSENHI